MTHGPEQTMEHAEHAAHAAHNPFDRRVSMTIAIVAAVLACITMLSHRAHNSTLLYQAEANRFLAEVNRYQMIANIKHTQATDQWNFFQANNIRNHQYRADLKLLSVLGKDPAKTSEYAEVQRDWTSKVDDYAKKLPELQAEARKLDNEAKENQRKAEECQEKIDHSLKESEHAHHQADRFDWGELAVELAVVLCSVAVLTKASGFWYSGMVMGAIGAMIGLSAFLVH
jgi:hypothetical protein